MNIIDGSDKEPKPKSAMEIIMDIAVLAVDIELTNADLKLAKQNRRFIQDAAFGGITLTTEQVKALQDGVAEAESKHKNTCLVEGNELELDYAVQLLKYWNERSPDRN
jgi:hypothetical protein